MHSVRNLPVHSDDYGREKWSAMWGAKENWLFAIYCNTVEVRAPVWLVEPRAVRIMQCSMSDRQYIYIHTGCIVAEVMNEGGRLLYIYPSVSKSIRQFMFCAVHLKPYVLEQS